MEIKEMLIEDIEKRSLEIAEELKKEDADVDSLEAEVKELEERKAQIVKDAEERKVLLEEVSKVTEEVEERKEEERMSDKEIRNTKEYIEAYARYIETGDDKQCRALLTENGSGTVAVPEFVYEEVQAAWNEEGIMRRVKKAYLKGNLKIGFEISAGGATKQTEGNAVNEQSLVMGIVELQPFMIKKWISISNQALRIDGAEAYLRFIYRELAHHIAAKAADELIATIVAAPQTSTTTAVAVGKMTATQVSLGLVAGAISQLADRATRPVVMMNKLTYAAFKDAQYAASYPVDPFEGCDVEFNSTITALSAATTGVAWLIVGDLENGALANFPDGEEINVLRDPYTLAASNLTRFVGDEYLGLGPIIPNAFVKVVK